MQTNDSGLGNFTQGFFKSLGCKVIENGGVLSVSEVPKKFEAFVGKKGPYKFVFSSEDSGKGELLTKGSFFVNAMANYVKTKRKTSLIKLDFDMNLNDEIDSRFTFLNCRLKDVGIRERFEYLVRFTFSTTFQYLNEKKNETIPIFIRAGEPIEFKIENYKQLDGKKEEVSFDNLNMEYDVAKIAVKDIITEKTKKVGEMLSKKLEKEIQRVEKHFEQQLKEIDKEKENLEKQIEKLRERLEKVGDEERAEINKKILKINGQISELERSDKKEKVEKEKKFFIEDEKHKHSLNISNDLINTTIIYYPIYYLSMKLEKEGVSGQAEVEFDPMQKYISPVKSKGSGEGIYKIHLCDGGEVCKPDETVECIESGKNFCKSLMNITCNHCGKPVHKNYAVKTRDGKYYARRFVKTDCMTGIPEYIGNMKLCPSAGEYTSKENFKECPNCGTQVCPKGIKRSFIDGSLKVFCNVCKGK